jgi:hypothetical protein
VVLDVPRDGAAVVRYSLSGTFPPGEDYRLLLVHQPLANPDDVTVRVHAADGWRTTTVAEPLVSDGLVATGSPAVQGRVELGVSFDD